MSTDTKTVTLADGRQVVITDFTPDGFHPGVSNISFQFENASGFPIGGSDLLVQGHPLNPGVNDGETVGSSFDAVALTGGGFEVAYTIVTQNAEGVSERAVIDANVGANGSVLSGDAREIESSTQALNANFGPPLLAELPGDRYVQAFESFDANHNPKAASPDGLAFNVANLADGFRPAVLKVVAADGSSDITWFDNTGSQTWDTLHATEDARGDVLTYGSTADNGTQEVFTFDATNTQAYTRYVDEIDTGGHVTQRTVLYDDGSSWTAKFALSGGQVVSYELDSFDAAGRQIGQSFFNADGTPLGH